MNPNLRFLHRCFTEEKSGALLEGGSRSGKSWSIIDFLIFYASVNGEKTINIVRETLVSFRSTLFEDFNRRLPMFEIQSPFSDRTTVTSFQLFSSRVNILGADDASKFDGLGGDIFWINEAINVEKTIFDALEQRNRGMFILDWNPKSTTSYIFENIEPRPDVALLRTTFLDNEFISKNERAKILSYEPTPTNIEQGTADLHLWRCYGLGLRSSPEGQVFTDITWIDKFPDDIDRVYYGSDIGTVSPSTVAKVGAEGNNLYVECLAYEPTASVEDYVTLLSTCLSKKDTVWCDSAAPGFIAAGQQRGYKLHAIRKFPGSRKFAAALVKSKKLHVVKNARYHSVRKEFDNFVYRTVNGIRLDEPVENNFDHFIDGMFYATLANLR